MDDLNNAFAVIQLLYQTKIEDIKQRDTEIAELKAHIATLQQQIETLSSNQTEAGDCFKEILVEYCASESPEIVREIKAAFKESAELISVLKNVRVMLKSWQQQKIKVASSASTSDRKRDRHQQDMKASSTSSLKTDSETAKASGSRVGSTSLPAFAVERSVSKSKDSKSSKRTEDEARTKNAVPSSLPTRPDSPLLPILTAPAPVEPLSFGSSSSSNLVVDGIINPARPSHDAAGENMMVEVVTEEQMLYQPEDGDAHGEEEAEEESEASELNEEDEEAQGGASIVDRLTRSHSPEARRSKKRRRHEEPTPAAAAASRVISGALATALVPPRSADDVKGPRFFVRGVLPGVVSRAQQEQVLKDKFRAEEVYVLSIALYTDAVVRMKTQHEVDKTISDYDRGRLKITCGGGPPLKVHRL